MRNQHILFFAVCTLLLGTTAAWIWTDYHRDWKEYQKDFYRMQKEIAETEEEILLIRNQKTEIKQILLQDNRVDRCITCHLGIEDPRFALADQPFRTHPGKTRHAFEKFGCTTCHQGQGAATTVADAHGGPYWVKPLLTGNEVQSSCGHCHDQTYLEDGPVISRGKELFISQGCVGCHKSGDLESPIKIGSSLKKIGNKVKPDWIVEWLQGPYSFQPNSKMPDFRLTEEEALSITAYLMFQSDADYYEPVPFDNGDPGRGKYLFRTVGCLGCHKMGDEGEPFAQRLHNIGNKVKPDWLLNWFLDPKGYNANTIMPKFRLSIQDAKDLTAFLLSTATEQPGGIDEAFITQERIANGKEIIRNKGCAVCHDINGITFTRIGPELSTFGLRAAYQLDFGNTSPDEIERTWAAWTINKLKNPAVYDTENSVSYMPTYRFTDGEREALSIFLKGLDNRSVPGNFIQRLSVKEFEIEQGRKAMTKYNCRGCHRIDGKGGGIMKFYRGRYNAPPPLEMGGLHVGDRVKDSWLYSYMRKPSPVREWLKVKMPTFMFTQEEIYYITRYFVNFAEDQIPYERGIRDIPDDEYLIQGRKLILAFGCTECHDEEGSGGQKFSLMSERLRGNWAKKWLKHTRTLYPGTKMPDHWPEKNGKHAVSKKFPLAGNILGGDVDRQVDAIWEYITNYNSKPFLDVTLSE